MDQEEYQNYSKRKGNPGGNRGNAHLPSYHGVSGLYITAMLFGEEDPDWISKSKARVVEWWTVW